MEITVQLAVSNTVSNNDQKSSRYAFYKCVLIVFSDVFFSYLPLFSTLTNIYILYIKLNVAWLCINLVGKSRFQRIRIVLTDKFIFLFNPKLN